MITITTARAVLRLLRRAGGASLHERVMYGCDVWVPGKTFAKIYVLFNILIYSSIPKICAFIAFEKGSQIVRRRHFCKTFAKICFYGVLMILDY